MFLVALFEKTMLDILTVCFAVTYYRCRLRTGWVDCPTSLTTNNIHKFTSALGDADHVLDLAEKQFDYVEKEATAISLNWIRMF